MVLIEPGQAVDLDTGATYTITTNPDFFNPVLAAAVDVTLNEVLIAGSGYNVVVTPLNGALIHTSTEDCKTAAGTFGENKMLVHFEAGTADSHYCMITSEGSYAAMVVFNVDGPQLPVTFFIFVEG